MTEHRHLAGILQSLPVPKWMFEMVIIDFITKLHRIVKQHDSIIVVVENLTNESHFIHVKTTHKETKIAEIYMKEFFDLHGVSKEIVSDKDSRFTSKFWKGLLKFFGTNMNLSTEYCP
jgi:hypothetical protein